MTTTTMTGVRLLVVGGSRGVGRALVVQAAQAGARVAFTWRKNAGDAEDTLAAAPGALSLSGDAVDPAHAKTVVDTLVAQWGGVDALAVCAGMNQMYPLALVEDADWDRVLAHNAKAAYVFARAVARPMIKQRRGNLLFFGSFASERTIESPAHYAASKSALRGLVDSLAYELGRYAIVVNLLAPSVLDSGLSSMLPAHRKQQFLEQCPAGRVSTADEVARAALFLLSPDNTFVTGAKLALDGGL